MKNSPYIVLENEIGVASSVLALVRNIAGAFGIAFFATILSGVTENNVLKIAHSSVLCSVDPFIASQFISLIILKAQVLAYSTVFQVSSLIVLCGAGLALLIKVEQKKNEQNTIFID